ncbi:MAG: MobC family plasmid mobilization relaxosome protein [Bdellovibrionales bacterium]|nr:MobC family plasmid mobilization relaxosome protein [Bdellovibrionales bacterium]
MDNSNSDSDKKKIPSSHVRFSEVEYKVIQKMVQATGLSVPDILKKAALKRMDLLQPMFGPEEAARFMTELKRQGNNINQMAKAVNSGIMSGWSQGFSSLVQGYVDLRHMIAVNRGNRPA